jgi:hypothetical protein
MPSLSMGESQSLTLSEVEGGEVFGPDFIGAEG